MLFAEREHHALALASSAPWLARSVGFVGVSDGWQELRANKRLDRTYARAENGNVALTGEIDLVSCDGTFVMALGFGPTAMEAGQHALISLLEDFDETHAEYVSAWQAWHARLVDGVPPSAANPALSDQRRGAADARIEARRRRDHRQPVDSLGLLEARRRPRRLSPGVAARPRGDRRRLHRHRRARARQARAALSAGDAGARRPLVAEHVARRPALLARRADGRNGTPDSPGRSCGARGRDRHAGRERCGRWCAGRPGFLARNGPVSPQDRWEEEPGYAPFTIATEIAALLVAADLADAASNTIAAEYLRETADAWNASIERWLYVEGTELRATARRRRLLRARRAARSRRCRVAVSRVRADQEPPAGSSDRAGGADGQPRRARARSLRPARAGRSAHPEHRQGHRRHAEGGHAARAGLASIQRRRLRRARRWKPVSTERASAARGRC